MKPDIIPPEVRELFNHLTSDAASGNIGVASALDKRTGKTRFVLIGRHVDGTEVRLVPLGELSTTIGDEVHAPGDEAAPPTIEIAERDEPGPPPMDAYNAAMIAEGVIEADDERTIEAWQYLEDTGLGYSLQGWFGRRLRYLIEQGTITPRQQESANG